MDRVLKLAGQRANIPELEHRLPFCYMWVDPGNVAVRKYNQHHIITLYDQNAVQESAKENSDTTNSANLDQSCSATQLQLDSKNSQTPNIWVGGQHA